MATNEAAARRRFHWTGERLFFGGMGLMVLALVFAGFAPSFFLRGIVEPYSPLRPIGPLVVLHGLAFTAWLVLFIVQGSLITARRHHWHRRLGLASVVLAVAMVALGLTVAVQLAARGGAPGGMHPMSWLWISLLDMAAFTGLVAAGYAFRHRPQVHKRLMLFATLMMLGAGLSRMPVFQGPLYGEAGVVAMVALTLPLVAWDLKSRGRVMAVTWIGIAVVAGQHIFRVLFWNTQAARDWGAGIVALLT